MIKRVSKLSVLLLACPLAWATTVSRAGGYTGAEIYAQSCAMCHSMGIGGAPKPVDLREIHGRSTSGRAELLLSVLRGKGGMPPKGGNASLSAAEASAALDYMLSADLRR